MKKLLVIAAVAVFGFSNVNAQEETTNGGFAKGDVFVSGSLGYNNTKQGDFKTDTFEFSPSVGYFVSENIALELNAFLGTSTNQDDDKSSVYGAGLGATYFFTPASQFSFTLGAGASYSHFSFEPDGGEEAKANGFGIAVAPGVNYFISDAFALRASIGALSYTSTKEDAEGAEAENSFGLNLDLSDINFGITYKF